MNARLEAFLSTRHEYRLLALMLVALHALVWWGMEGPLARPLMLAHLGLFLVWQPLWSRERRLTWGGGTLVFLLATLVLVTWLNWSLVTFWVLLLTGLVGGRITLGRTERYAYLITLMLLVSELLIRCVPNLFEVRTLSEDVSTLFRYGLLALPAGLLLMPGDAERGAQRRAVDFVYGLIISLLAGILAMGTLVGMYYTGAPYAVALFQTITAIAVFLLAIAWLWNPFRGFSGLGQLWEQYLLNIGTPFEGWLARLENLARRRQTPDQLLHAMMAQFAELPWVAGVEWRTPDDGGRHGRETFHRFTVEAGVLRVVVHAHRPVGAALLLHGKLLIKLIAHFHRAKEREEELAQRAHLQAVYETGARITHDIKNLLQSLHTMSVALQQSDSQRRADVELLLRRQLPHLTNRLQLALDKLQAPEQTPLTQCHLSDWWESFKARHEGHDVRFEADIRDDDTIPLEFFDSVAENLLENARAKRQTEPGVEITIRATSDANGARLSVEDTGSPVDPAIADRLFKGPVASRSGLGIGLYQAARQAEQLGYSLSFRSSDTRVRFELAPAARDAGPAPITATSRPKPGG